MFGGGGERRALQRDLDVHTAGIAQERFAVVGHGRVPIALPRGLLAAAVRTARRASRQKDDRHSDSYRPPQHRCLHRHSFYLPSPIVVWPCPSRYAITIVSTPTLSNRYLPSITSPSRATTTAPLSDKDTSLPGRPGSSAKPRNFTGIAGRGGGPGGGGGGPGVGVGLITTGAGGGGGGFGGTPKPNGSRAPCVSSLTAWSSDSFSGSGSPSDAAAPRGAAAGVFDAAPRTSAVGAGGPGTAGAHGNQKYRNTPITTTRPNVMNCRRCCAGVPATSFTGGPPRSTC